MLIKISVKIHKMSDVFYFFCDKDLYFSDHQPEDAEGLNNI